MNHNPVHANYYADQAIQSTARVLENVQIARDTFRLRFECPEMAGQILPGQFLMVRMSGLNDPLIGRPLALYDTMLDSQGVAIAVDAQHLGGGARREQRRAGRDERLQLLGRGAVDEVVLVHVAKQQSEGSRIAACPTKKTCVSHFLMDSFC